MKTLLIQALNLHSNIQFLTDMDYDDMDDFHYQKLYDNDSELAIHNADGEDGFDDMESILEDINDVSFKVTKRVVNRFDTSMQSIYFTNFVNCDLCGVHGYQGRLDLKMELYHKLLS